MSSTQFALTRVLLILATASCGCGGKPNLGAGRATDLERRTAILSEVDSHLKESRLAAIQEVLAEVQKRGDDPQFAADARDVLATALWNSDGDTREAAAVALAGVGAAYHANEAFVDSVCQEFSKALMARHELFTITALLKADGSEDVRIAGPALLTYVTQPSDDASTNSTRESARRWNQVVNCRDERCLTLFRQAFNHQDESVRISAARGLFENLPVILDLSLEGGLALFFESADVFTKIVNEETLQFPLMLPDRAVMEAGGEPEVFATERALVLKRAAETINRRLGESDSSLNKHEALLLQELSGPAPRQSFALALLDCRILKLSQRLQSAVAALVRKDAGDDGGLSDSQWLAVRVIAPYLKTNRQLATDIIPTLLYHVAQKTVPPEHNDTIAEIGDLILEQILSPHKLQLIRHDLQMVTTPHFVSPGPQELNLNGKVLVTRDGGEVFDVETAALIPRNKLATSEEDVRYIVDRSTRKVEVEYEVEGHLVPKPAVLGKNENVLVEKESWHVVILDTKRKQKVFEGDLVHEGPLTQLRYEGDNPFFQKTNSEMKIGGPHLEFKNMMQQLMGVEQ